MSQRKATFPFPPVEDGLLLLDLGVVESKEEVPPLGTEVFIGEVREAIAFC
jgi:hypothetical protein